MGERKSTREGMKFHGEILDERVGVEETHVASAFPGKWKKLPPIVN